MSTTDFKGLLTHLGGLPVLMGIPFSKNANYYFVDTANGSSSGTGSFDDPVALVSQAENLCTANQQDTVIYMAGSSTSAETATITWDKNYTNLVGIGAPTGVAQRTRIHNETTTGQTPLLNVTATGCTFKNFYIFQGVNEAVANINVQVTGGRNYFENVHFAGGGHTAQAIDGGASLKLDGAEENTFVNCTIGVDTIAAATGMVGLLVDGSSPRNVFKGCQFTMAGGNAGAAFVEFTDISAIDRYLIFRDCLFVQNGTNFNSAFVIPSGFDATNMQVILHDCTLYGADDWEDQDRGAIVANMGTITGGGNAGIAISTVTA